MTYTAAEAVKVARSQIGYRETRVNITKYNDWLGRIPGYAEGGRAYPWCQSFQSWVASKSGGRANADYPKTAGCETAVGWFKRNGRWAGRTPHVGDMVFYGPRGGVHVELVVKVTASSIVTIGGNTSGSLGGTYWNGDGVYQKTVARGSSRIYGYGRPAYQAAKPTQTPAPAGAGAFGVDYAWGRPSIDALKAAGAKFVCRYLSHDTTGKNLTRGEADQLSAAGIWIVVVWETSARRALAGAKGGIADAEDAAAQARACGMPEGRPIYFAVDWDATQAQQVAINGYLDGAASVLGRARVGIYGGHGPVARALDAGKARWAWQTLAWSAGRWDSRAHIRQYAIEQRLGGADVDYNRATRTDFGQWRVGVTPTQEDDMLYGQLADGPKAITPISIHPGWVDAIGFWGDNGLQQLPPAKLRVAIHDAKGWYAESVVVDSAGAKPWLKFRDPKTTDGASVQRLDDGAVRIAWDAS